MKERLAAFRYKWCVGLLLLQCKNQGSMQVVHRVHTLHRNVGSFLLCVRTRISEVPYAGGL